MSVFNHEGYEKVVIAGGAGLMIAKIDENGKILKEFSSLGFFSSRVVGLNKLDNDNIVACLENGIIFRIT